MLRQELKSYFDRVYPYFKIDTEHTLGGQVHIRFGLGEGKENGTIERVNQSTDRAFTIFKDTFKVATNEIFVLIKNIKEKIFLTSPMIIYTNNFLQTFLRNFTINWKR